MHLFIICPILLLLSQVTAFTAPNGVCSFDANAFTGGWYELASSYYVGETIERGCQCPVAYYTTNTTNKNNLDITNSCIRNGQYYSLSGNAFPSPRGQPGGNLRVVFSGSPSTNDTSPNYIVLKQWFTDPKSNAPQFALVGGSDENTWWFISRTPNFDDNIWYNANYVLQGNEYNITGFNVPAQTCQFLGGHGPNLIPPHQFRNTLTRRKI